MADLDRLSAAQALRKSRIRAVLLAKVEALWKELTADGRVDDLVAREWLSQIGPLRAAAILQTAMLVDAYVDQLIAAQNTKPAAVPVTASTMVLRVRNGADPADVVMRPIVEARSRLADGLPVAEAMSRGLFRATSNAATDVQRAYQLAFAEKAASEPAVTGYRRVLRGSENCMLCVVASTRRYHSDRLMPIHPGCDCAVQATTSAVTGGGVLVDELPTLEAAEHAAGELGLRGLSDRGRMVNLKVNRDELLAIGEADHGELGPLLKARKHRTKAPVLPARSRREFSADGSVRRGTDAPAEALAERL